MNSGADSPTDRAGLPPASHRLDSNVSRVVQTVVPAGAGPTSFWLGARHTGGRLVRRAAMPLGWSLALLLCAGSAFAVRDVLFPSLGVSAARSVWEPRPVPRGAEPLIRSTTSAERPTAAAPADVVVDTTAAPTETSAPVDDSVASWSQVEHAGGGAGSATNGTAGSSTGSGDDDGAAPSSSAPSPSTTFAGGDDGDDDSTATSTPTHSGVTTTTDAKVTTTTDADVTTTSDAATGDTIADQSGRRGSGPGGGGGSDDDTP